MEQIVAPHWSVILSSFSDCYFNSTCLVGDLFRRFWNGQEDMDEVLVEWIATAGDRGH